MKEFEHQSENAHLNLEAIISKDNSIYETWRLCNAGHPDLPAVEYFGNQWTFAETEEMIDVYARAFLTMLPDKTKTVTFCVPTLPSTLFAFYALNKMGIRANFVSHTILPSDPKEYIDETDTGILVLFDGFFPAVAEAIAKTCLENIIVVSLSDGVAAIPDYVPESISALLHKSGSAQKIQAAMPHMKVLFLDDFAAIGRRSSEAVKSVYNKGDTAVLLYTGGSTGVPKGVEITNEGCSAMARIYSMTDFFCVSTGDRNLILIPPNHPTSFVHSIVMPWLVGVSHILQPLYNRNTFAYDLYHLKANIVMAAPSHYAMLPICDLPDGALSHIKILFCGGEAVSVELASSVNKSLERLGAKKPFLIIGYGMSEIGPMTHIPIGVSNLLNKVGMPLPGVDSRIVDDNGRILGDNVCGNLEIKSPCRMKGYYKQPELTKAFFTEDGYARTGDIAIRDENGNYDVLGRASDSIIAHGGSKVFLFNIERTVYKDDAVLECEVVGLEANGAKVPVVHIVLNADYAAKVEETILRIHNLCREYLSENEMPHGYKIREAFGTNPISAKRDYRALELERDGFLMPDGDGVRDVSF